MGELHTDVLYARVSAQVSSIDGIAHDVVQQVGASAFVTNMADLVFKLFNRITNQSATLNSGASAASIVLNFPAASQMTGLYHGVPFAISGTGTMSADPGAVIGTGINTTSLTVRKVLVGLSLGDISGIQSGIALGAGTLAFVNGSTFNVSYSLQASIGSVSAVFNKVPTPRASAGMIPLGIINIPNSFGTSQGHATAMLGFDQREIYGANLSAIFGSAVEQP